jgi:hypothetical protein
MTAQYFSSEGPVEVYRPSHEPTVQEPENGDVPTAPSQAEEPSSEGNDNREHQVTLRESPFMIQSSELMKENGRNAKKSFKI